MSEIAISADGLGKRYRIGALARQTYSCASDSPTR